MAHIPTATAAATGNGTFQSTLDIAGTIITADEPLDVGGLGTGPMPYDLLAAALATCTTMTLRFYAKRNGWDVGAISTTVTHARVPGATPPDQFTRTIHFPDHIDAAMREELIGIAGRCPVHKTLSAGSRIETTTE